MPSPSSAFVCGALGGTVEGGHRAQESVGWGRLVHPAVGILFSNLFFGSLVLPDPERGINAHLL